jgi:hypothetical protein
MNILSSFIGNKHNHNRDITVINSTHITLNDTPKTEKDDIYLIYQYYLPNIKARLNEVQETLRRNIDNPYISKIYILGERLYTNKELGLEIHTDKIVQEVIGRRMLFGDVFTFVEKYNLKGYIMTSNSDIFFDDSISKLHYSDLNVSQTVISLLRWEYRDGKHLKDCKLYGPTNSSQDSWIFHSNFNIPRNKRSLFNIPFGILGCDNKILHVFRTNNFLINNNPIMFRTYHYHDEKSRTLNNTTRLQPPYVYINPELYYTNTSNSNN